MLIKSLEIQGFKSFPDKTVLSFGKGITAVVGPNGSGKSNISDAVRWVLGEQSTKSLRGAKMEDVVFAGTANRKAQGFAQVSMVIDNADRRIPFDGDEVVVTRRYYRSGESEYLLNKASVRLRDVHELFMDTGLGRDGYSIISQGKIADIVGAKSDDRREVFEEAAGISKYRYRKNEAERRLGQAQENLLRLKDILTELEDRVGPLKEQAEKAKRFLEYAEVRKRLEIGLWLNTLEKSANSLRRQEEKLEVIGEQHRGVERQMEELQRRMDESFSAYNQKAAEIDEVRRAAAAREELAAKREGEISVLENDIRHNNETIERFRQEINQAGLSFQDMEEEIRRKRDSITVEEANLSEKQKEIEEVSSQLEHLRLGVSEYSERMEQLSQELGELSRQSSEKKVEALTAESSLAEIENRSAAVEDSLDGLRKEQERLLEEMGEYREQIKEHEAKAEELSNTAKGYEMRLDARKRKAEELKAQADRLSLDVQERERRAAMLEDLEKNLEGFAHSVKMVVKEGERGTLHGIHGPVSRLLHVPEKYAIAIEIGLGGAMQNVVCSNEEDAKRAIAFLKKRDGGRATFLPLTGIRGSELSEKGLEDCFGFVGIASSLVDCDPRYDGIKKSLLGRIAVAEDLDAAVDIAKKYSYRFRVVTLDGQVVNAGGSLTGGSLARNAGLLNRTNEIKRIREEAASLSEKWKLLQQSLKSAQQEASAAEAALGGTQAEISVNQEDKIRVEAELRGVTSRLEACRISLGQLEKEKESAAGRMTGLSRMIEKARKEREALKKEIEDKEERLSLLTGDREKFSGTREALSERLSDIRLEAVALEKDIASFRQAIAEMGKRKEEQEERSKALKAEVERVKEENRRIEEKISQLREETAGLREKAKQAETTIASLSKERMELEQASSRLRQEEREKSAEKEAVGRELSRLEEQKASLQKEYDDIIRRLWDEYELTRREAEENSAPVENVLEAQKELSEIKGKIKALGSVNMGAIDEYAEVSERYEFLKAQVEDVEKSRDELTRLIHELTAQMKELFLERFRQISRNFQETFRELFGGGSASLELSDPGDVLNCGIEISVQPQGKIITHIDALSGGEKSLAAIALYFAIMKVSPTPFCILDEIEAALDDVNVDRFAAYLRRMSDNTQFIVITHRRGTMEEADVLYGVTMQEEGVSKLLELHVSEVEQKLGKLGS